MTNNKGPWILLALAVGVLALTFFAGRWTTSNSVQVGVGAPGTRSGIEEYIPYIKYNEGYYSLLGITTTATVTSGANVTSSQTVGASGTAFTSLLGGLCYLNFGNAPSSFAASTTKAVDCQGANRLSTATIAQAALTGVNAWTAAAPGSFSVQLASSSPTTYLGVSIQGCSASTTAGYITCNVLNGTGAAFTPGTTTANGVNYTGAY